MAGATVLSPLFLVILALVSAKVPSLSGDGTYSGSVSEQGGTVDLDPPLTASDGPICGYRLINKHKNKLPFQVFMLNQETGAAEIRASRPINCETRRSYKLQISAVSCTGEVSKRSEVVIKVLDVNEFSPTFSATEYSAQVAEGELSDELLTVAATDEDCSTTFGTVCGFNLTSPAHPFTIDQHGTIRNTEPLSAASSRTHVVGVVARDCGGRTSDPVLVTINVLPKCITSWTDVSTSMTYIPGTGPQPVFPTAKLQLCAAAACVPVKLEAALTLHTDHVGVGCDRDTYSLASQRKMCGASSAAVDLLPVENDAGWLKHLSSDKGREVGPVYHFDGVSAATVPEEVLSHDFGKEFTISAWLRHQPKAVSKHAKEHIMCLADDHRKNRHHLAFFIRNCKLVLLTRREYLDSERNIFKPAEFRWTLPQLCDDKWHHYAVSVSADGVDLTLDGELWRPQPNNPEVIDDWPLHPAADLKTTLTVGGCWHGSDNKMQQQLNGYMAGLAVLPGRKEHAEVLKCLVQCSESLQLPATNLLDPGMEMITNSQGSQVTIDGADASNLEQLVRQVAYVNTREFPAPGRRRLELTTTVTCGDGSRREVPVSVSRVLVLPVPEPTITLSATTNTSATYSMFKGGVRIFKDIRLSVTRPEGEDTIPETLVDKCTVSVFPPLNPDHEAMALPELMLKTLNLEGSVGVGGAEVRGADMMYNYEEVLRQVVYTNQKPAYYLNRQFKLVCSDLNDRFTSNEYIQTVTVVHPSVVGDMALVAHREVSSHGVQAPSPRFISNREFITGQTQGHAVVAIVFVCVVLLVGVLGVGVYRLRTAHTRTDDELEVEMAWDDTALNITVNPLEESECRAMGGSRAVESDLEDSSDDDLYGDESSEDDDDEGEGVRRNNHRLEWDNDL